MHQGMYLKVNTLCVGDYKCKINGMEITEWSAAGTKDIAALV